MYAIANYSPCYLGPNWISATPSFVSNIETLSDISDLEINFLSLSSSVIFFSSQTLTHLSCEHVANNYPNLG